MIRRDYILRAIQEMVQVLARVVFLKSRREYDQALREINRGLQQIGAPTETEPALSLEDWIALCRKHEPAAAGLMPATADLLCEQGEVLALQGKAVESQRSRALSLGLILEALLTGEAFVSAELLTKVEKLIEQTNEAPRPGGVWRRLVRYLEERGQYALAEDALFTWAATGDAAVAREGEAFYERLFVRSDVELERGRLPRTEVQQGRDEFKRAANPRG